MSDWHYHALHRLLFAVHAVLASYVAGGTLWLALRALRRGADDDPIAATLRDWLPFALGLAITFGVGPLLFIQLGDGHAFYTANLLLGPRLLALLPALIVGFYLLYVQKTNWRFVHSRAGRFVIPFAALLCFAFTAKTWSENHLLAQNAAQWAGVYAEQAGFAHRDVTFRLLAFFGMALQSVAVLAAVQSRALRAEARQRRRLSRLAILGTALALGALVLHPAVPGVSLLGIDGAVILSVEALIVTAWWRWSRTGPPLPLAMALGGVALLAERLAALRETVRLARGGADQFAANASSQGLTLFCFTFALVAIAIAWAVAKVKRDLRAAAERA